MYMRAITIRIACFGVLGAGIVLAAAFGQPATHAAPPILAAAPALASVAAPLPVVTLPTVNVRAAGVRSVKPTNPAPLVAARVTARADDAGSQGDASLPAPRLDMPYYSFGKLLPRVGKE